MVLTPYSTTSGFYLQAPTIMSVNAEGFSYLNYVATNTGNTSNIVQTGSVLTPVYWIAICYD